jgi:hypothetical protein
MLISLKSGLGAGSYTVRWTTLAADGDTAEGSFSFTVRAGGASASPSASASASPSAGASGGTAAGGSSGAAPSDTASTLPATGGSGAALPWLIWLALALCGGGLLLRRQIRRA